LGFFVALLKILASLRLDSEPTSPEPRQKFWDLSFMDGEFFLWTFIFRFNKNLFI
jgi:hypothetical protein